MEKYVGVNILLNTEVQSIKDCSASDSGCTGSATTGYEVVLEPPAELTDLKFSHVTCALGRSGVADKMGLDKVRRSLFFRVVTAPPR